MALSIVVPVRDIGLQRLRAITRRNLSVVGSVASEYLIVDFDSVKYRYEDLAGLDKRIRVVRTERKDGVIHRPRTSGLPRPATILSAGLMPM